MSPLRAHLAKDARDHAATWVAVAALLTIAAAAMACVLPRESVDSIGFVRGTMLAGSALGLVAISAELVPSERARGTLTLLCRLPGGLRCAAASKLLLALAAPLACAALGWLSASLARALVAPADWTLGGVQAPWVGLAAIAALWTLALSSFVPRGLIAVLGAGLLALPYAWAELALADLLPHIDPSWHLGSLWRQTAPHAVLALAAVGLGLARGPRFSIRAGHSLLWGGPWVLAAMGCGSAWAIAHVADARAFPLDEVDLTGGWLSRDGRTAFVNARRPSTGVNHALRVRLADGSWVRLGAPGEYLSAPESGSTADVLLALELRDRHNRVTGYVDRGSGQVLAAPLAPMDIEMQRRALRERPLVTLADGRRAWLLGEHVEIEAENGDLVRLPWTCKYGWVRGKGIWGKLGLCDVGRARVYAWATLPGDCTVLGARWLVADRVKGRLDRWRLLDPDSGATTDVPALAAGDRVVDVLEDGRVVCQRHQGRPALVALDPERGTVDPLTDCRGVGYPLESAGSGWYYWFEDVDPPLYQRVLFRLCPDGRTFSTPIRARSMLGVLGDHVVVLSNAGIERVHVESGEHEVLFPRPRR